MRRASAGFTLLELMAVISIMAILAAIAIPGFGYLAASTKIKSASTELYLAMIRARGEAVKRNRAVSIVKTGSDWQSGWQIIADGNNDGDFDDVGADPGDRLVSEQGALKGVTITMAEDEVRFWPSGRVGFPDPPDPIEFDVSGVNLDDKSELRRCVSADITGKPYIRSEAC